MTTHLTEKEKLIVYFIKLTLSIISTIGILFLFIFYITKTILKSQKEQPASNLEEKNLIQTLKDKDNEKYTQFAQFMIFLIAFAHLFNCIATFIYNTPYKTIETNRIETYLCVTQSFLYAFSETAIIFLNTGLSYFNLQLSQRLPYKFSWWYFIYGIGFPLLMSLIYLPGLMNIYGQAGAWCWISSQNGGNPVLVPIITMIIIVIWWINMIANIALIVKASPDLANLKELVYSLRIYSILMAICWFPGTIIRIVETVTDTEVFGLFVCTGIGGSIIGFCFSLVYLFSEFKTMGIIFQNEIVNGPLLENQNNDSNRNEEVIKCSRETYEKS